MKVILLSGFLGAGKTSLLLQLAKRLVDPSEKNKSQVAIIENEIGKVSIDSSTLKGQGLTYRELISGCVCCSIVGEFENTLEEIQSNLKPDWIIVEASGLAFPNSLSVSIREAVVNLELLRIIVLVDAVRFLALEKVSPLVSGQVGFADVIFLNKVDLVEQPQKAETIARLQELNKQADIMEIVATEIIPEAVMKELVNREQY